MRKIISLVLALALALCGIAFAEETAALCEAEYTVTENGANVIVEAAAENVTFDVTENYLNEWVEGGFETVTFKCGSIKTSIKLASMLEQGNHFNIILNNAAEMDEGEAKAAAGVAKSSAKLGFMLVNEDGTLTDLSDKLEGSVTLYVAWDGATGSIRAITNNGSGYQRTQMNYVKGYENGMTTVTCYRLISASYITLEDISYKLKINGFVEGSKKLGTSVDYYGLLLAFFIDNVPVGTPITVYYTINDNISGNLNSINYTPVPQLVTLEPSYFVYNSKEHRWEAKITVYAVVNGKKTNKLSSCYYYESEPS